MDGEQHGLMGSLPQTREENENSVNLNPFSYRKINDIVDKYIVFKFFARKPCLIPTQIKRSRVSISVN